MKTRILFTVIFSFVLALFLAGCAAIKPGPVGDAEDLKMTRFDNIHNYGYCEIFLIGGNGITKDIYGLFYNTTDYNGGPTTRQSCPADLWAKQDKDTLKKEYDVLGVFLNGPRIWLYDWIELPTGVVRDFNGLKAKYFGKVYLPKDFGKEGATFYIPTLVDRKSHQGYRKGTPVFILDDPSGVPWLMQAASQVVDKTLTYEDLKTLDTKLNLPPGWKFRWKVLEQDLVISAINGQGRITQDNLQNTYNSCDERNGEKACNYKP